MKVEPYLPFWLIALAFALGFVLTRLIFFFVGPSHAGVVGFVLVIACFVAPYQALKWLYSRSGNGWAARRKGVSKAARADDDAT